MLKQCAKIHIRSILLLTAITFLFGCGSQKFREPVTKFRDASAVVIASTQVYLTELNKVERNHYVNTQLSKREQIDLKRIEEVQVFSQEGLNARLEALDALGSYGELLYKLANSDAPEKIRGQATDLGDALKNLGATTGKLTGADNQRFQSAVGPVTTIIGEILSLIVQSKINQALETAIRDGEQPINNLLAAIRDDTRIALARRRTALSGMRAAAVDEYNREFAKGAQADPEKLRIYAQRIRENEDRWEIFENANPRDSIDAMAKAHSALVKFAKSKHKAGDFTTLVDSIEAFAASAQRVGQAVQALRQI